MFLCTAFSLNLAHLVATQQTPVVSLRIVRGENSNIHLMKRLPISENTRLQGCHSDIVLRSLHCGVRLLHVGLLLCLVLGFALTRIGHRLVGLRLRLLRPQSPAQVSAAKVVVLSAALRRPSTLAHWPRRPSSRQHSPSRMLPRCRRSSLVLLPSALESGQEGFDFVKYGSRKNCTCALAPPISPGFLATWATSTVCRCLWCPRGWRTSHAFGLRPSRSNFAELDFERFHMLSQRPQCVNPLLCRRHCSRLGSRPSLGRTSRSSRRLHSFFRSSQLSAPPRHHSADSIGSATMKR